ncbi:hypothetical protein Q8A73_017110 [Channa argus]|nr:hypothetical protein Q8A73_017110 [Channa argus]
MALSVFKSIEPVTTSISEVLYGMYFLTVSRVKKACYGQTDPGALRTSTGKKPLLLEALQMDPEGCQGHRAAASTTELQRLLIYPTPTPTPTIYLSGLQGIKKANELMKMSEVIKRGGNGDTDPERVSEGQEVHMGPRPACSSITLLSSSVPSVPRLHGTQIWLDWPAGHGRRSVGDVGTQGRWRERQDGGG